MNLSDQLKEKVLQVQSALLAAHPSLPGLLAEIHKTLKNDPAQVTLLDEDEIGILVSGLSYQTKVEIATTMAKDKTGKAMKKLTVEDI